MACAGENVQFQKNASVYTETILRGYLEHTSKLHKGLTLGHVQQLALEYAN